MPAVGVKLEVGAGESQASTGGGTVGSLVGEEPIASETEIPGSVRINDIGRGGGHVELAVADLTGAAERSIGNG